MEVYDGGDDTAPLIGEKLCGDETPQAITSSGIGAQFFFVELQQ